ncbi:unnamed protein product [Lampetra fluviatilis]
MSSGESEEQRDKGAQQETSRGREGRGAPKVLARSRQLLTRNEEQRGHRALQLPTEPGVQITCKPRSSWRLTTSAPTREPRAPCSVERARCTDNGAKGRRAAGPRAHCNCGPSLASCNFVVGLEVLFRKKKGGET